MRGFILIAIITFFNVYSYAFVGGDPFPEATAYLPVGFYDINAKTPGQSITNEAVGFIKIGERVLLSCAHCVDWSKDWSLKNANGSYVGFDGKPIVDTAGNDNPTNPQVLYMLDAKDLPRFDTDPTPWQQVQRVAQYSLPYDISVIVIPKDFPLSKSFQKIKPITISTESFKVDDKVYFFGNGSSEIVKDSYGKEYCGGKNAWAIGVLKITDLDSAYFAASGEGLGKNGQANAYTCSGDSGGLFIRVDDKKVSLSGLTSRGSTSVDIQPSEDDHIDVVIPAFTTAGVNLASPQVREWLKNVATQAHETICGINTECESLDPALFIRN